MVLPTYVTSFIYSSNNQRYDSRAARKKQRNWYYHNKQKTGYFGPIMRNDKYKGFTTYFAKQECRQARLRVQTYILAGESLKIDWCNNN